MKIVFQFMLLSGLVVIAFPAYSQNVADIKIYEVNRVTGSPPTIDGDFTEEEWAGSEWTGEFYGLRHSANTTGQGQVVDLNWRWRALWDDDYLYVLVNADLRYINPNGWIWAGTMVPPLVEDDVGYASWGTGENLDFELFITPNWDEDTTFFFNEPGENPPAYQLCYFPLLEDVEGDTIYADSNFGVRGAEGPPFFNTGNIGAQAVPGFWNPIYEADAAAEVGAMPFQLAALPHLIEGAVEGVDIVGSPVLEVAIPYSQLSFPALPDVNVIEDVDIPLEPMIMIPDENGNYVQPGDEWLFNICGYTDGPTAEEGLALITWNDMGDGGFHNAPRGKLVFMEGTVVRDWMLK